MLSLLMTTEYAQAEERHELQRLLLRVAGGEREALAELYQRTRSAVYGLALSYLKNAHDAQDLTQDVYVQVWDCAEQYRPTGSPMGWLLAVCRNLCLMRLRREERHAALSEEEWDAIPAQECGLDADERTLLQQALASLGEEERRIITEAKLTERHARALLRLEKEEERLAALKVVAERGMNVAQTEHYIEQLLGTPDKPQKPRRRVVVRDVRIFMNTIHHAVDVMKQNGIKAQSWKRETDQYLEYVVRIPTAGQALFAAPGGDGK